MSVIIITRCFFLLLRRKQHHKTRNFGGMSIRKRISRLIVDKEKTRLPTDPPSLKDAPHIDSLFKRVTMGAGHKEDAYLVLRTNSQQIKNSHYETKKGKVEFDHTPPCLQTLKLYDRYREDVEKIPGLEKYWSACNYASERRKGDENKPLDEMYDSSEMNSLDEIVRRYWS